MQLDELNVLRSETRKQVAKKKLRDYFEVMELLAFLIEERIDLAFDLYVESYQFLIKLNDYLERNKAEKSAETDKYVELFKAKYRNALRKNNVPEEVIDALDNHITRTAEDVVNTTIDNVKASQESNKEKDIEVEIDKRATLIAETETNVSKNTEQYVKAIADGKTKKTWITMRDDRVRKSHIPMEGQTIKSDDLFNVNGSLMRYPCDDEYGANPKEIIDCRCVVEYHN